MENEKVQEKLVKYQFKMKCQLAEGIVEKKKAHALYTERVKFFIDKQVAIHKINNENRRKVELI